MKRNPGAPRATGLHATGLAAILLTAMAGSQAQAQAQFRHDGAGRIIAMSNLSPASDCFPEIATGVISERHLDNGGLRGVTFRDDKSEEIYLNITEPFEFRAESMRAKVAEGYAALLGPTHTLRIGFKVCGAAGRIKKLDAISLVGARAATAAPAARSGGDGVLSQAPSVDDPDQALLRSPGSMPEARVPAAAPRLVPVPQPAPQPAASAEDDADLTWEVSREARAIKAGVSTGSHFTTIYMRCVNRSGMVEMVIDDLKGRYRERSRQSFSLTAGVENLTVEGSARISEMENIMQITTRVSLEALRPVLTEVARGNALAITTRAERTVTPTAGAGNAAAQFLSGCSRGR